MNRKLRSGMIHTLACVSLSGVTLANAQQNGAPPGHSTSGNQASGKSAGVAGGAGAAGQSGTDPATLSRMEEERVQKNNAQSATKGASNAGAGKRKDWKE
ncbi:hypothetical protein [Caballeronia sp. AZ7_KS35]|uniref:hypothetical protein n=1 Tax=Caballeronia sp. AZ7_KS35 TaxID=2921762 RepID=UPI002027CC2E|nr:hypothetical protein [Caballeronia sp. AZ7_KS35]